MNLTLTGIARQANLMPRIKQEERNIPATFQRIEVLGDITLLLVKGAAGVLLLKGNTRDLDCIKTIVKDKTLVIDAQEKKTLCNLAVYVSASDIIPLIINGDAKLSASASGIYSTRELEIILNGDARVTMDYEGKVRITQGEERPDNVSH